MGVSVRARTSWLLWLLGESVLFVLYLITYVVIFTKWFYTVCIWFVCINVCIHCLSFLLYFSVFYFL